MAYDNTNSGALFKNDNKRKETDRDYNGQIETACPHCGAVTHFWMSAWLNIAGPNARNPGAKFFSLKFNPKEEKPKSQAPRQDDGFDDDIPF